MNKLLLIGLLLTGLYAEQKEIVGDQDIKETKSYYLIGEIPLCDTKEISKNSANESMMSTVTKIKSIDLKTGNIEYHTLKEGYENKYEVCKEISGIFRLTVSKTEYKIK